jgi:hypothetical protein
MLSNIRTSVGHGCIGRPRPPADVRRTTCRPPKPTTGWSGQTCPTDVFRKWFSRKTSKVTTLSAYTMPSIWRLLETNFWCNLPKRHGTYLQPNSTLICIPAQIPDRNWWALCALPLVSYAQFAAQWIFQHLQRNASIQPSTAIGPALHFGPWL